MEGFKDSFFKTICQSTLFRFFVPLFLVFLIGILISIGITYYQTKDLLYKRV